MTDLTEINEARASGPVPIDPRAVALDWGHVVQRCKKVVDARHNVGHDDREELIECLYNRFRLTGRPCDVRGAAKRRAPSPSGA